MLVWPLGWSLHWVGAALGVVMFVKIVMVLVFQGFVNDASQAPSAGCWGLLHHVYSGWVALRRWAVRNGGHGGAGHICGVVGRLIAIAIGLHGL